MLLLSKIAGATGVSEDYLRKLARTASRRYKKFEIDKKRGGGKRTVYQPSAALKYLQRWIIRHVTCDLPIHEAATAYSEKSSILQNAQAHVKNNFLIRLDFHNFFPSISRSDLTEFFQIHRDRLNFVETDEDVEFIIAIVTRNGRLTIGSPSSPSLSNQIMYNFDTLLWNWCITRKIIYTRYADDIYLSTNRPDLLRKAHQHVKIILQSLDFPKLTLNEEKTLETSRKHRRLVTGISLTSDQKISLGREKKRKLRALVHKFENDDLDANQTKYLSGFLAFAKSIEPEFVKRLENKYPNSLLKLAGQRS
jgi:RNA-directed DNA polymerase